MELTSCYFDQYQRYETVKRIINIYKEISNEKVSILDIGGAGQDRYGEKKLLIKEFLPEEECHVLDVMDGYDFPEYIKGNGENIPFPNNTFDFVITNDTLEHIKPDQREKFIKELNRVTKKYVILTAPFYSEENYMAENIFNEFLINIVKQDHFMLKEHIENGLPNMNELDNILKKQKLNYTYFQSGDIYKWLFMNIIKASLIKIPNTFNLHYLIDKIYNENFYENDKSVTNGYRNVIVISKNTDDEKYYFEKVNDYFKLYKNNDKNENNKILSLIEMVNLLINSQLNEKKYINSFVINDKSQKPSPKICKGNKFEYQFSSTEDNICGISCLFATYNKKLSGTLKLCIVEKEIREIKATTYIDLETIEDNLWHEIKIPIFNTNDSVYELIFETYNEEGLSIWMNEHEEPCMKILHRDFEVYEKNKKLSELVKKSKNLTKNLECELNEKNINIEKIVKEKEELILEKDKLEEEKEELILEKDKLEEEKEELILEKDKLEEEKEELILEKDKLEEEKEELVLEKDKLEKEKEELKKILKDLMSEFS